MFRSGVGSDRKNSELMSNSDDVLSKLDNNQTRIQNHYEVPNLSSMLYEYTNNEVDRVKQSFRVGNFISLRGDMPRHFLPGNVAQLSKSKIEQNLYSAIQEKSYIELANGGGYFSKFEYIGDDYEPWIETQREERAREKEKMLSLHKGALFQPHPKVESKFKHHNVFSSHLWQKDDEQHTVGFLC